jgi:hypothetical protein
MDHWFDNLTKTLAGGASRRSVLWGTLGLAGAAFLGRFRISQIALAQGGGDLCSVRQEGRTQIITLSASSTFKGEPLSFERVTRVSGKVAATTNDTFKIGGQTLLQMGSTRRANSTQVTINYGDAFKGIHHVTVGSTDGRTLRGNIDGRQILPFRLGGDPNSVEFADRRPPPKVDVDADLAEAMKALQQQALKAITKCSPPPPPPHPHSGEDSGHDSSSEILLSSGCIKCRGKCIGEVSVCLGACAVTLFAYFVCAAACAVAEVTCLLDCSDPGEGCCPVSCGKDASLGGGGCCAEGETCTPQGTCCSPGLRSCGFKHCCKANDTCIPATGECCPKPREPCGNVCCKSDEACIVGTDNKKKCCPKLNKCGSSTCCDGNSRCADAAKGLCCSFAVESCKGLCCKLGEECINGKCCPKPRICGTTSKVCCGSGQACKDGKCIAIICPSKQVTCVSQEGPDKSGAAICCPPNVQCCLGKCCKPGEICCSGGGTPFGCHDPGLCVA